MDKESNCNKDTWKHVDVVKPTDDGIWRLKLDLFKAGEFVKNGSVVDIKAVISTESIGIGLPKDAFDEVMKKIKLVDDAKSLAECKLRSDLPNLVFQIGGNMYEVSPQQYLIDVSNLRTYQPTIAYIMLRETRQLKVVSGACTTEV